MNKNILPRDEFIARFNLQDAFLREWEKANLVKPAGYTDGKIPLYSEETSERVVAIQKLTELGYETDDIQKILKKIGLPKTGERKPEPKEPDEYLTVGDLAERVGLSPRTIKHWEDKGIIEPDMRSEGGFRLYTGVYVQVCELVRDLQLFGYTLEEIKEVSDSVRALLAIQDNLEAFPPEEVSRQLGAILKKVDVLFNTMGQIRKGIKRWEDLLKKKKKEISDLYARNRKREAKKRKGKK
jgi:DNA-binding transcriptional MerR regulator